MSAADGGPAFPTDSAHQVGPTTYHYAGMSLRDYFAGQALTGLLAAIGSLPKTNIDAEEVECQFVEASYSAADAMLRQRAQ